MLGICGPFTDVSDAAFCPFVLEIFSLGITTGTTPTTYDPASTVNRLQMAAFLSRTVDGALRRGSRRAILDQFWTTQNTTVLGMTTVLPTPNLVQSDGADVWVACSASGTVARVRASDGKLLETWTGATNAYGVVLATGKVFATGPVPLSPGNLFRIDPSQAAGAVTTVATNLGINSAGAAFDGARIWVANNTNPSGGSVSIVTPGASIPWTVTTVTTGFNNPGSVVFDGAFIWTADFNPGTLLKLDSAGAILQTVQVCSGPSNPVFDGANIWAPCLPENKMAVVRASTGAVLQTLTGNGLNSPAAAAFDGQRILVTNEFADSVSLWKAADLTPLGTVPMPAASHPLGAASDGLNFWIALAGAARLARF